MPSLWPTGRSRQLAAAPAVSPGRVRAWRTLLLTAIALILAACSTSPPPPTSVVLPAGWQAVNKAGVEFALPPGWQVFSPEDSNFAGAMDEIVRQNPALKTV